MNQEVKLMSRKVIMIIIAVLITALFVGLSLAGDEELWTTTTTPDALIILDQSGSMDEMPQGGSATFYLHGSSTCTTGSYGNTPVSGVPYYNSAAGSDCLNAPNLYASSCTGTGPFTTTAISSVPQGNLYVAGTDCTTSNSGPYSTTIPTNICGAGTYVYTSGSSTCSTSGGPFYKTSGGSYTFSCTSLNVPSVSYTTNSSTCSAGPWYRTTGSSRTQACYKTSTLCSAPLASASRVYTASDCSVGPWYRTSGSGHTTPCSATTTSCSINTIFSPSPSATSVLYSASDCISGPFHKNSSSSYPAACYVTCNNQCTGIDSSNINWSVATDCSGPYYTSSGTGHTTNCSKIAIAKRALFDLMDNNNDSSVTSSDITSLGMRLGYMRYYNCPSSGSASSYTYTNTSSCINLPWGITQSDNTTTTPYANIYCGGTTCTSSSSGTSSTIAGASSSNYTPLAYSIREGTSYLNYHKSLDASATCRQKSIILVTDGADTIACSAGGNTNAAQREAPIYYANAANKAGYKVYVVGFGSSMPASLQNTLNWMAYYGGTRNPTVTQSGSTTAVTVSTGTDACSGTTDPASRNLSGYAFMASDPESLVNSLRTAITSIQEATYSFSSQASVAAARVQQENFLYEASFEPKNTSGSNKEPFWTGHLKKYRLNESTGGLITPAAWDAGAVLASTDESERNMYTYKGTMTLFDTSHMADNDFGGAGTSCGTSCNLVVGFYRGDPTYNLEGWKLGDLYHTNPVVINTPSAYFYDPRECGSTSFTTFRTTSSNIRTAANGQQIIVSGSNDAQFHAFRTGNGTDYSSGGDEVWSFIAPNLLQKMAPIAHNSHADRTILSAHDLFMDGPIQVADVWMPATAGSGTSKNASDWKTVAIISEGGGSGTYLWSSSSSCYSTSTSAFSATYSSTTPYYCGIYAMDVTNTLSAPSYLWTPQPSSSQAPYLGQAWSKMQIGRVKIGGNEKWVGLIGAGYNASTCTSSTGTSYDCTASATDGSSAYRAGKGFLVIDMADGTILWSFTHGSTTTLTTSPYMDFSAPAAPLALDLDNDGFIDTVYMGDLGGNMWRFRFCPKDSCAYCGKTDGYTASPCTNCGTELWTGSRLFSSSDQERGSTLSTPSNTHKQIFTSATWAKDGNKNLWIYFGTGENNDPTTKPSDDTIYTKNRLYAIMEDTNLSATYTSTNLTNITNSTFDTNTLSSTVRGWYINLSTNSLTRADGTVVSSPLGEKMISDPTVAGKVVYFPTYIPDQGTGTACGLAGDAFLYKLNFLTGASAVEDSVTRETTTDPVTGHTIITTTVVYTDPKTGVTTTTITVTDNGSVTSTTTSTTTGGDRTQYIGHGIGSSVLVSYRPGLSAADVYATASGGAGTAALTQELTSRPGVSSANNIIYWKDKRLE
jgi:Tfp pilus tip-associated adhesin PilY1